MSLLFVFIGPDKKSSRRRKRSSATEEEEEDEGERDVRHARMSDLEHQLVAEIFRGVPTAFGCAVRSILPDVTRTEASEVARDDVTYVHFSTHQAVSGVRIRRGVLAASADGGRCAAAAHVLGG